LKLVADIKLCPNEEQSKILCETLKLANKACNYISEKAWQTKKFRQFDLHKICYADVRERFSLTAQTAVRCIGKVADAYKLDKKTMRQFREYAAQPYDARIFRFCNSGQTINIWTIAGRIEIPFVCGAQQREMLKRQKGEVDLVYRKQTRQWFLCCTVDVEENPIQETNEFLGIDLGVVNIAVDSTGEKFSGRAVDAKREWYARRKARLQPVGTKAAKRRLRKLSGRQKRFQSWTNHNISKHLVSKAKCNGCGIALEDLKGIRERIKARKSQKAKLHNWSFFKLRQYFEYKAKLAGVRIVYVDPRNTSRTCPDCGHCAKENRKTQNVFTCVVCGHSSNADYVGAINIARAAVNQPNVLESRVQA